MRVRLRFSKLGKLRWTSHRDVARMWERAFRRVQLPLAHTQGFSPRPRLSFGLALPTGAESTAEYLDVELAGQHGGDQGPPAPDGVDPTRLPGLLTPALPAGMDVLSAVAVDPRVSSLQDAVTSCTWMIEVTGATLAELERRVGAALAADSLVLSRERKGRIADEDIRPGILSCRVVDGAGNATLECELATQPRGIRPSELLRALGDGVEAARLCRTHQWIERDGARREPDVPEPSGQLTAGPRLRGADPPGPDATNALHVTGRAS